MKCKYGTKGCQGRNGKFGDTICVNCYTFKKPRKRCRCKSGWIGRCKIRTTRDNQICSLCDCRWSDRRVFCVGRRLVKKGT